MKLSNCFTRLTKWKPNVRFKIFVSFLNESYHHCGQEYVLSTPSLCIFINVCFPYVLKTNFKAAYSFSGKSIFFLHQNCRFFHIYTHNGDEGQAQKICLKCIEMGYGFPREIKTICLGEAQGCFEIMCIQIAKQKNQLQITSTHSPYMVNVQPENCI